MISHEVHGIGCRSSRETIRCIGTLSLNQGSLLVEGHRIVAYRETFQVWFLLCSFLAFSSILPIVAPTDKEVEAWEEGLMSSTIKCAKSDLVSPGRKKFISFDGEKAQIANRPNSDIITITTYEIY
jgi:hypothetical protein